MSLILKDRCKQKVAANAGTNSITLTTAVTGFKTISSTLSNGDSSYFCLESGSSWEVFIGTYTSSTTTVSRDTVLASSNSGNKIDIGSGITVCYIVYPADKATYKDGSGRIVSGAAGIIFSDASIQTTAATTPDLSAYAPLASPTFTGTPAAPTATSGTNTTQLATTAFVASAVGSIDLTPYALLPDTLPAVGTLLSYGGSRQLAAGGTVTHSGALNIGANAFTCGAITASAIPSLGVPVLSAKSTVDTISATVEFYSHTNNPIFTLKQNPSTAASGILTNVSQINGLNTISVGSGSAFGSSSEAININSGNMMVGYDGSGTKGYVGTRLAAGLSLYTNNVERLSISSTGAITASGDVTLTGTNNAIYLSSGGTNRGLIYYSSNENRLYSLSYPWVVESNSGFKVRNSANSADAALTCGAITATGQITEVPPSSVTLSTNGQFSIEMTSDTAGNLVYRGSDGVTRRCALVFA